VFTVIVVLLLLKVPLGPEDGAVNVTLELLMGLLPASFTVTDKAVANGVEIGVDWLFPEVRAME
jgi:hypothetical protein